MIATGNNNISNIKVGNTQIKSIYLGTSGVWSNKMRIDYTVKNYLYFSGDVTQYGSKLNGFNANLSKSITWDTDNYILKNTINHSTSPNKNITYDNGYTIFEQINTFTDTIYKSDLNKYKYFSSTFSIIYTGSSGQTNVSHSLSQYNNPLTVITNGQLNNSVTMNNANLNIVMTLDTIGGAKFAGVILHTTNAQFYKKNIIGVPYIIVVLTTTFDPDYYRTGVNIDANTKYKLNDGKLHIVLSSGGYNTYSDVNLSHDDFINEYTYDGVNNTVTLTQYYEYTNNLIQSGYDTDLVQYWVRNDNLNGHVIVSLDGTFTENEMIGCIYTNNFYIDGTIKIIKSFTSNNTGPISITATNYKTIFEYTLTDIYD